MFVLGGICSGNTDAFREAPEVRKRCLMQGLIHLNLLGTVFVNSNLCIQQLPYQLF